jgi:hypothetical protein
MTVGDELPATKRNETGTVYGSIIGNVSAASSPA